MFGIGEHDDYEELCLTREIIDNGVFERWDAELFVLSRPENFGCDSRANCSECTNFDCPHILPF